MLVNELPQRSRGREPGIPDETQSFDYAGWGGSWWGGSWGGSSLDLIKCFMKRVSSVRSEWKSVPFRVWSVRPPPLYLLMKDSIRGGGGGTKVFRHLGNKFEIRPEVGNVVDAASNFDSIFSLFPLFRKYFQSSQIKFIS